MTSRVRKRRRLAAGTAASGAFFKVSFTLGREKCHAGASPVIMPVSKATSKCEHEHSRINLQVLQPGDVLDDKGGNGCDV